MSHATLHTRTESHPYKGSPESEVGPPRPPGPCWSLSFTSWSLSFTQVLGAKKGYIIMGGGSDADTIDLDPIVTLYLPPDLIQQQGDAERTRACRKLQSENPEYAPTKASGSAQTFSIRYTALRHYVYSGQADSSTLPAELRYMRLFLLLLVGPPELLASYLEYDTFRAVNNFRPKLIKAFAEVVSFNHSRDQKKDQAQATAIAALHGLCFTKLGRQRTNFAWLRFRDQVSTIGPLVAALFAVLAIRLGSWLLVSMEEE